MGWIFFLFFLIPGIVVMIVILSIRHRKRIDAAWKFAANRLSLAYHPARGLGVSRSLSGAIRDCKLRVDVYVERHGKNSTSYTRYEVCFSASLGFDIHISRQGLFDSVKKLFGAQDIEIGDKEFDDMCLVRGSEPDTVRAFLGDGRRAQVVSLMGHWTRPEIHSDSLIVMTHGVEGNGSLLAERIEYLVSYVHDFQQGRASDIWQTGAQLLGATSAEPDVADGSPDGDDFDLLDMERAIDEAMEVDSEPEPEPVPEPEPGPVPEPDPVPDPEHVEEAAADPEADHGEILTADDLAAQLFVGMALSSEVEAKFEPYVGKKVTWSGVLKDVQGFHADFVFTGAPGTKVVLEVGEVQSSMGMKSAVRAVVRLEDGLGDALMSRKGETIGVTGTLFKVKSMMKEFYLSDGELL